MKKHPKFIFQLSLLNENLKPISSITTNSSFDIDTLDTRDTDIELSFLKRIILESLPQKLPQIKFYAVRHKPTKTWVYFRNNIICLAGTPKDATRLTNKRKLKSMILSGSFNGCETYGMDNFLEFEIKNIK